MSHMGHTQENLRALVENTAFPLVTILILKPRAILRIEQAIRRDPGLADLLEPVEDYIELLASRAETAHNELMQLHRCGEANGWK